MIMRMPIRTAITASEPDGRKLTISPSITVTTPRNSVACHVLAARTAAGTSSSSGSMNRLLDPYPPGIAGAGLYPLKGRFPHRRHGMILPRAPGRRPHPWGASRGPLASEPLPSGGK